MSGSVRGARARGLNRLLGLLGSNRGPYLATTFILAVLYTSERLFMGFVAKTFTDAVTAGDLIKLKMTVFAAAVFYPVYAAVIPVFYRPWQMAIYRGLAGLRERLFAHLQRLPLAYHELHHSGDAISVMSNDLAAVEDAYRQHFFGLVHGLTQGLAAAAAMLALDVRLALISMASSATLVVTNAAFAGPLRRAARLAQDRLAVLTERLADLLAGFEVIRSFNLGPWAVGRFAAANAGARDAAIRRVRIEACVYGANNLAMGSFFLPVIIGASWMLTGRVSFGIVIGMVQFSNGIMMLMWAFGTSFSRFQAPLAAADRIWAVLAEPAEPERYPEPERCAEPVRCAEAVRPAEPAPLPVADARDNGVDAEAAIRLRDVVFAYDGDQTVLNGLSFTVLRGRVVALVGPSGAGKSTVFKLLLGFYPARAGAIEVAGRPLASYRLAELRDLFAFVPQDAYLFDGTIAENIRFGRLAATDDDIVAAAMSANAHEFIMALPDGYRTRVGERGSHLSGGQKQRIAIARAVLKNAPFLLLDEATAALDTESEQLVQEALERLMAGRTTLVVAHRLATVQDADEILVIDGGRVVERGRHADLLAQDGLYRRLHDVAFKTANEGGGVRSEYPPANGGA